MSGKFACKLLLFFLLTHSFNLFAYNNSKPGLYMDCKPAKVTDCGQLACNLYGVTSTNKVLLLLPSQYTQLDACRGKASLVKSYSNLFQYAQGCGSNCISINYFNVDTGQLSQMFPDNKTIDKTGQYIAYCDDNGNLAVKPIFSDKWTAKLKTPSDFPTCEPGFASFDTKFDEQGLVVSYTNDNGKTVDLKYYLNFNNGHYSLKFS